MSQTERATATTPVVTEPSLDKGAFTDLEAQKCRHDETLTSPTMTLSQMDIKKLRELTPEQRKTVEKAEKLGILPPQCKKGNKLEIAELTDIEQRMQADGFGDYIGKGMPPSEFSHVCMGGTIS